MLSSPGIGYAADLLNKVGNDSCGDDSLTNKAFKDLGNQLPTTRDALAQAVAVDVIMLAYVIFETIYTWYSAAQKRKKAKVGSMP